MKNLVLLITICLGTTSFADESERERYYLTGWELNALTLLMHTVENWEGIVDSRTKITYAGDTGNDNEIRLQVSRSGFTGEWFAWRDLIIKADTSAQVADAQTRYTLEVREAAEATFQPHEEAFFRTINAAFQNPDYLRRMKEIGNTILIGALIPRNESETNYTFIISESGPWADNYVTGSATMVHSSSSTHPEWQMRTVGER